jgi:hypothetical protein
MRMCLTGIDIASVFRRYGIFGQLFYYKDIGIRMSNKLNIQCQDILKI